MTEQIEIANTIIAQLGGRRFSVMVGMKNPVALESGVMFNIGTGAKSGINRVVVRLMPSDTYTVEFWKIGRSKAAKIEEHEDVYAEDLQAIFTAATGFYTSL